MPRSTGSSAAGPWRGASLRQPWASHRGRTSLSEPPTCWTPKARPCTHARRHPAGRGPVRSSGRGSQPRWTPRATVTWRRGGAHGDALTGGHRRHQGTRPGGVPEDRWSTPRRERHLPPGSGQGAEVPAPSADGDDAHTGIVGSSPTPARGSPGHRCSDQGLCALGGIRTPNLLIRRPILGVDECRHNALPWSFVRRTSAGGSLRRPAWLPLWLPVAGPVWTSDRAGEHAQAGSTSVLPASRP